MVASMFATPSRVGMFLVTTGGLGRLRPAPGTWGSLPPVLLALGFFALHMDPDRCTGGGVPWYAAMTVICLFFGWVCVRYGDEAEAVLNKKDPGPVCADETCGMALTILLLPKPVMVYPTLTLATIVLSFFAFRLMDIIKPWPANRLQDWPGGWGILMDDVMAAVYAACLVWLVMAWGLMGMAS